MIRTLANIVAVLFLTSLGCGGGAGDVEGGIGLGDLEGSYDITKAVASASEIEETETPTCMLKVSGSRVTANCEKSGTFDGANEKENLEITVVVKETEVSGTMVYTYETDDAYWDEECLDGIKYTRTFTVSANKLEGRMITGVFSPLAGDWEGEVVHEGKILSGLVSDGPSYCYDGDYDPYLFSFDFSADIGGNTATIDWEYDEYEYGTLEVIGTSSSISVNGGVVEK